MNAIYLDQALLSALDWHSAGTLSSAISPFGLIVKNESEDYWIVQKEFLLKLEFESDARQFLICDFTARSSSGLTPFRPNVLDRFISWLRFGLISSRSSQQDHEQKTRIQSDKARLFEKFDEGDITTKEFLAGLDKIRSKEIDLMLRSERKLRSVIELPHQKKRIISVLIFVFAVGLCIGPVLYRLSLTYNNAEECVLARGGSRGTVAACYELYPSASELRTGARK